MQKSLILSILIFSTPLLANEYTDLQDQLRERYQDFYIRLNDTQKRSYETKAARKKQTVQRNIEQEDLEKTRKAYVKARKNKPEVSDELHEKEVAERKKAYEKTRKAYVSQQEKLSDIKSKLEVPEWVEYKLYDETLVSDSPAKSSN